jgi:hypothetical protein
VPRDLRVSNQVLGFNEYDSKDFSGRNSRVKKFSGYNQNFYWVRPKTFICRAKKNCG